MILAQLDWNWQLDGWIVVAGILCAVAAALPGNFLVLRKMSMLGDAISHAVLPGLAVAFLISGTRNSWPMFLGAVLTGIATAMLTEWIRRAGRVDEGASMGVVFTTLFALGLVMIVQAADLDPGCVLYGAIEFTPLDQIEIAGLLVPRVVPVLGTVLMINLVLIVGLWKEFKISSFDPELATSAGINARLMHYLLMTMVAVTAVASFESVGNILVVAMLIVPPATAYLLTDRLGWMTGISVVLAVASAVLGHLSAIVVPGWFGYRSTTTAGMMATVAGMFFLVALLFSPRHGLVIRSLRQRRLSFRILREDILAWLYRAEERIGSEPVSVVEIQDALLTDRLSVRAALAVEMRRGHLVQKPSGYRLTSGGREQARQLVRSHRLWEQYLVEQADLPAERIHDKAERLEHVTDRQMRDRLQEMTHGEIDPHGSPIPPEDDDRPTDLDND